MDFGIIPPEITSARMHAGAGSAPLLAAATAWGTVSATLAETATVHSAAINSLATVWMGPSSLAMQQAATAYSAWLTATAAQADRTAAQALAALAAYETAFAATVAPPVIAANRVLLSGLVATNLLGQNTAAIAAAEAQYAEYWAQDAAAMYAYRASSFSATAQQLTEFSPPTQVANLIAKPLSTIGALLNPNGVPLFGLDSGSLIGTYLGDIIQSGPYQIPTELLGLFTVLWGVSSPGSVFNRLSAAAQSGATPAATAISAPAVRVSVGTAQRVGLLRTPPDWARPTPGDFPAPGLATPTAQETPVATPLPMPLPLGIPRGGTPMKQERPQPEYGQPVRFITRPPAGG